MNTAKLTMISASMALALGLTSVSVLADEVALLAGRVDDQTQIDDSVGHGDGNAVNGSNVDNRDNRTYEAAADRGGIASDDTQSDVGDGNANDGSNIDNSDYRDLSDNSHSLEIGDISLTHAVNGATLDGEVSRNDFSMSTGADIAHLSNTVDDSAFSGASGLNQNVQNNGAGSLVQQQVNFQGNINVGQ